MIDLSIRKIHWNDIIKSLINLMRQQNGIIHGWRSCLIATIDVESIPCNNQYHIRNLYNLPTHTNHHISITFLCWLQFKHKVGSTIYSVHWLVDKVVHICTLSVCVWFFFLSLHEIGQFGQIGRKLVLLSFRRYVEIHLEFIFSLDFRSIISSSWTGSIHWTPSSASWEGTRFA